MDKEKDNVLYIQAIEELSIVNKKFDAWWFEMYDKYKWKVDTEKEQEAYIDFRENVVFCDE